MTEGTSRIDALSDGVFAIAITLLILEIRLPHEAADGSLRAGLLALWPNYFAFALSFFVILVSWIAHHDVMRLARVTNHPVLLANGCVLAYVSFLPFSTAVLASHLDGAEIVTGVTFYCATFVFGSAAFNLLVATIARCPGVDIEAVRRIRRGFRLTFTVYVAATLIALVAPWVALALNVAMRVHLLRIRYQQASQLPAGKVSVTEGASRIEAFSDGVYAIAATLLILEIIEHEAAGGSLQTGLLALWPNYFALALSFFVILVSWVAHHDVMRLARVTNHPVQLANGCVLFYVTFIPFPTAVLAANLGGPEISTAVTFYCATFVFGSAAFNLLVATIARHPGVDLEAVRRIRRGFRITFTVYVAATLIALVAPWVALAMNVAMRVHLLRIRYQSTKPVP